MRVLWLTAASVTAVVLSKLLVEDPVRFRARWARGRRGVLAVTATFAAIGMPWLVLPLLSPAVSGGGAGSVVDATRYGAP
ncbi:hypothetical protein ACGFXC_33190 [Streptomyces sp. NPDC048507]|uniref:hypothetical protein n=1 Tax=Streptomyces sp. NPDC048507 TaxID=3365560 RepID=UPI00370FE70E